MSIELSKLGKNIERIRGLCGFTQSKVYELTGVSCETQRRIEHGLKEAKLSTLERLSVAYKVDLVEVALEARYRSDFFSERIIKFINSLVKERDFESFNSKVKEFINELVDYRTRIDDHNELEVNRTNQFIRFLISLKDLKQADVRNGSFNIIELEKLLYDISNGKDMFLSDYYLYNIEYSVGLLLALMYRYSDDFDKSLSILGLLETALERDTRKTLRKDDYRAAIELNKMTVYHRISEHEKVIHTADQILCDVDIFLCTTMSKDILFRKAIAMYYLERDGYKALLSAILQTESGSRLEDYKKGIKSNGISVEALIN